MLRRIKRFGRNSKRKFKLLIISFIPLFVGIGFIYIMTPGAIQFSSLAGSNGLVFITATFLMPHYAYSYLPWLAWLISGFVGGFIFRGILTPFLFTIGYAWVIVLFGGGSFFVGLGMLPATWTGRVIILNTLIAGITFLFGAWIGHVIRS